MTYRKTRQTGVQAAAYPRGKGLAQLAVTLILLADSAPLLAQHGGRGGGGAGLNSGAGSRPIICVYDCRNPSSRTETDKDLQYFEHVMTVHATPEQSTAFAKLLEETQAAGEQLSAFHDVAMKSAKAQEQSDLGATLDRLIEKTLVDSQHFVTTFSPEQKSGLRDLLTRLTSVDSDAARQLKALDEVAATRATSSTSIADAAASLEKALANFKDEELALGSEMSILPASRQDLTIHFPQVTSSAEIGGQTVALTTGGAAKRVASRESHGAFDLRMVVDLSDLQDNITDILRARLDRAPRCGERVEVRQAMLLPESAASMAIVHLHYERWSCLGGAGRTGGEQMMVSDDAASAIKLTASVEQSGQLHLTAEISRVKASGFLRDMLQSSTLGAELCEEISGVVLSALEKGVDLKTMLPAAALPNATMQKVQFQDEGAGQLSLVLDGGLQLSDEQSKQFAAQLKQRLSAQAASEQ